MRNHTATHIVLGAARKALGNHVWQAGAHKAPDLARLDITHYDALTDAEVARIEELANGEVLGHHQVRAKVLARDVAEKKFGFRLYQGGSVPGGELRVVEIPKWDVEACGGTHVSRTSDVSLIKILRSTRIQDGVVRLEYAAGKGALEAIRKQTEDLRRVGEILAAPADQIVPTAERIMGEWKELRKVAQKATDERAAAKTKQEIETAKGTWPIVKDEVAQGVGFMMSMSKATASEPRVTGIYWAAAPNDVKLVLTRGVEVPVDAAELVRTVAPEFRGKGGGKPDFAQASFPNVDMARAAAAKLEELIRKKLGIRTIERALLARLSEEHREAFRFAAIVSALVHGVAPLIAGLLPVIPFLLLDARTAAIAAIVTTLVILFVLGVYLGNLVRERVLVTGLRFAAAGIGTALILWFLGARLA